MIKVKAGDLLRTSVPAKGVLDHNNFFLSVNIFFDGRHMPEEGLLVSPDVV